ncbi:MAG: CoB--CoM heterodisulfide reductase subunit B [Candidatus Lokiarchaeota archaeon]|nr:CoB--CoM heterodisulfide reductase subunit B [Candidatus Lokiarchaeota archaeon]
MLEYALFLGCNIPNRLPHLELAIRKVLPELDIKLNEIDGFGCCPDPIGIQALNYETWATLAARNICVAEEAGLDILTLCMGCYETLKTINYEIKHDLELKEKINKNLNKIGKEIKGSIEVYGILEILYRDIGVEKIKEKVTNPLGGLKVAAHYGCHALKPAYIIQFDDPAMPVSLDKLIDATGAKSMPYLNKNLCCGTGISGVDQRAQLEMIRAKFHEIRRTKLDCLCTLCPLCYIQLEMGQRLVNKEFDEDFKIPVFHYAELLALAMGIDQKELGFKFHRVKLKPVLEMLSVK